MSSIDEDLLARYVEAGLEHIDRGETVDVEKLCKDAPQLIGPVGEALGYLGDLPRLQRDARDHDPWLGVLVSSRYKIGHRLGSGAMGAVYQAFDQELQREVAIKRMHPDRIGAEHEARFLREALNLASLDCDHLVRVYDRGRHQDGSLYLVMERLQGLSLASILLESEAVLTGPDAAAFGRIDWLHAILPEADLEGSYLRQLVVWAQQIAEGLSLAHAQGIFHRDVKPSNIHITLTGRAVLLDFGIAVRLDDGALTNPGTAIGTPWYMAPEQATGGVKPDGRIDIYGLCASLYHLLSFAPPFGGEPMQVLSKLRTEDPVALARLHPGLPRDLAAAIEHGMEREPRHRYQSAEALRSDLEAFLEHRALTVRPLGVISRNLRRIRRRPARAFALTATLSLLIVVALALPIWAQLAEARSIREHAGLTARLPALLALEGYPAQRLLVDRYEREIALRMLDRILSLRPEDLATRVLRLALMQDMGLPQGVHDDLLVLRRLAPGPFMQEVAQRFAQMDVEASGVGEIDLTNLPDPKSDASRFVAGFFALRKRTVAGYERAYRWLSDAGDYGPARDLLQIALLAVGKWQDAHDTALVLEGVYGTVTGRTRHTLGAALLGLHRYEEAIPVLRQAHELCPQRHGPLQNLGVAHLRLGDYDTAIDMLNRAHSIRPWLWNTLDALAQAHSAKGESGSALRYAERIPSTGSMGESWRRPYAIAGVHRSASFRAVESGDASEASRRAQLAIEAYKKSAKSGAPKSRRDAMRIMVGMLKDIESGTAEQVVAPWAEALAEAPLQARAIQDLASLLPTEGLDAAATESVRLFLFELAAALAPGDPAPRAAADRQRTLLPPRTK